MISVPLAMPVLTTKLFPADAGNRPQLQRSALIERLHAARDQRLVVLSAPAGFGKSTLLSQFRQRLLREGARVAWLSCDEADSEPRQLLQYLIAAIDAVQPGFGASTLGLVQDDLSGSVEAVIDALVADLRDLDGPFYLMLDDFHRIRHPILGRAVRYLIERLPDSVHLITSSRYSPRFISDERSLGLNAKDLSLTRTETEAYFHQVQQLPLSPAELDLLQVRTEGWITALHLAALALVRHPDPGGYLAGLRGTERTIADYLDEDVFQGLPEALQRFLEQTSVLDEFNAELCNALTGRQDGPAMLERLHSEQLFVSGLDAQGQWLRYHPLFAEFLQGRLAKRTDPTSLLHAAACWCEGRDRADRAITYALRGRDYIYAAELLERQGAHLVAGNRVYGVLAILKEVPAEVIREHPVFQIFYAWQLAFEQRFAESEALIEEVSTRLLQGRGKAMHYGLAELQVAAQVLKALVLLYQDQLDGCLRVSRHWLKRVPDNQPVFHASLSCVQATAFALLGEFGEAGKSIGTARACLQQADSDYLEVLISLVEVLIHKAYGELEHGRAIAEAARERVERVFGRDSRVGGPLALAYADLLYELDQHAPVLAELPLAITWRDLATPLELISRGQLVMARASFFAGEPEQGLARLEGWLQGLQGPGCERVLSLGLSCKVQFLLWLRRLNDAERACQQLECLPAGRLPDMQAALALSRARLALCERRPEKAQAVLESALLKQTADHQRDRRLRLSLLLGVAYWRKGHGEKAFALLQSTLEEGWGRGYRRIFLDDAAWLLPLWEAWRVGQPERAQAWQALGDALREQCRRLASRGEDHEENHDVSHRELEVLRLVAAGLSNRDIAQTVHLSEATIKWHLHNLFVKLSVRSRTQAVLEAKRRGLLSEA